MKAKKLIRDLTVFLTTLILVTGTSLCLADEPSAEELYDQAKAIHAERSDTNLLTDAIEKLTKAAEVAKDDELLYKIYLLHSSCLYWKGTQTTSTSETNIHAEGRKIAAKAITLEPDFADAYYEDAAHHVRWGEYQNIAVKALHIVLVQKTLKKIKTLDTSEFDPGATYASYGADRILGAIYMRVPSAIGGDVDLAVEHLKTAYRNAQDHGTNILYYAEALSKQGNKEEAKKLLNELINVNPETFNPDRIPETKVDIKEAKELLKEIS